MPSLSCGVSAVICCHNSARRLPQTLRHLAAQLVPEKIDWEVIVVDNASTDRTADVARANWPRDARTPIRVVLEPGIGLSNARKRGFLEARHNIVSFIDDDNWVCPEWIELVSNIMTNHPDIAAG
jgi:glycosyltransferase involved in cell wall biosynthesis